MCKKRPFLLLEVLIAFSLVTLFFTFYLRGNFTALRKSYKQALVLEKMRVADLCFVELKQKLWKGELSWDSLDEMNFNEEALTTVTGKKVLLPFRLLSSSTEKETHKGLFKKVTVQISFEDDTTFTYLVVAKKV